MRQILRFLAFFCIVLVFYVSIIPSVSADPGTVVIVSNPTYVLSNPDPNSDSGAMSASTDPIAENQTE